MEPGDGLYPVVLLIPQVPQPGLGMLDGDALLAQQVVDLLEGLYVILGVLPPSTGGATRLRLRELRFLVLQGGGLHADDFGDLADGVVQTVLIFLPRHVRLHFGCDESLLVDMDGCLRQILRGELADLVEQTTDRKSVV